MATFPEFHRGKDWPDFTVAEWKHLTEQVKRVAGLTVLPPLVLGGTHATMSLSLDPSAFPTLPRDETVVMPNAPAEDAQTLTVYRVRYKTQPPRACITDADEERGCGVALEAEPIVAYPDFGHKAVDYAPYASSGINDETTYLTARYRHGSWLVAFPPETQEASEGSEVAVFRVKSGSDFPDHIVCRTWDGSVEGDTDVKVAKPYLLRRTPFDGETRDGISYEYSSHVKRTATADADTEDQVLIPSYVLGDEILAVRGITRGTTVFGEPDVSREARLTSRSSYDIASCLYTGTPFLAVDDRVTVSWTGEPSGERHAMLVTALNVIEADIYVRLKWGSGDALPVLNTTVMLHRLTDATAWEDMNNDARAFAREWEA